MNTPLQGKTVRINNDKSPWYDSLGTVVEQDKDGSFLVRFAPDHVRYVSGMDFCLVVSHA